MCKQLILQSAHIRTCFLFLGWCHTSGNWEEMFLLCTTAKQFIQVSLPFHLHFQDPLSGCLKASYDQGAVPVKLPFSPQLWFHFAAALSQHLPTTAADQHSVFPVQTEYLPPLLFSCLQPHTCSPSTNPSCYSCLNCEGPSDCKFSTQSSDKYGKRAVRQHLPL